MSETEQFVAEVQTGPSCTECGKPMRPIGYKCQSCGSQTGCTPALPVEPGSAEPDFQQLHEVSQRLEREWMKQGYWSAFQNWLIVRYMKLEHVTASLREENEKLRRQVDDLRKEFFKLGQVK